MKKTFPEFALFKTKSPLIKHTNKNELCKFLSPVSSISSEKNIKEGRGEDFTCIGATWLSPVSEIDIGHLPALDLAGAGSVSNGHVRRRDHGPDTAWPPETLQFYKEIDRVAKKDIVRVAGLISGCRTGGFLKFNIPRVWPGTRGELTLRMRGKLIAFQENKHTNCPALIDVYSLTRPFDVV